MMRILLALWCVGALCVALTNPLGEAPDEPAHFDYVRFLVQTQRLPVQCAKPCVSEVPGEGHQPPLAYAMAALLTAPLFDHSEWVPQALNPHFIWQGGSDAQALIHGTREQWPWQGTFLAWRISRLISLLWVGIGIWLVWRSALAISTPPVALIALVLLTASPQTALLAGSVSNDSLFFALTALCVYRMLTVQTVGGTITMSAVIALALITKQSAIVLLPTLLWPLWRMRTHWQRIWVAGICTMVITSVAGWWYWRNALLYGDVFGLTLFRQTYQTMVLDLLAADTWRAAWQQLVRSAWGVYGWMTIPAPSWWYLLTATITIAALCGVVIVAVTQRTTVSAPWWPLAALVGVTGAWLVSFAYTVGAVAWQFRLAIPAIPALTLIMAAGIVSGLRITLRPAHVLGIALALTLGQQWIWWYHVLPRFPLQMPAPAQTAAALQTPTEAVFATPNAGGGISLLDYAVAGEFAPGNTIEVRARWQALTRAPVAWSVFIWLINDQKATFVQQTQPLYPMIPTTAWSPGDRVYSQHQLTIPADLPAGNYIIQFGLIDAPNDMRAHLRNYAEKLIGDSVRIPFTVVR